MVCNYSIKELSHTVTRAVFKWHTDLTIVQFSSVQFSSAQFEGQATTGLSLYDCYSLCHIVTLQVLCGHLGIIVRNIH